MTRWQYMGDVSLERGGTFYDFADWQYGYVSAVEVVDLDSACGFRGAVLIEPKTILINREGAQLQSALACIGAKQLPNGDIDDNRRVFKKGTAPWRWCIAYACQSYGYADPENGSEVVQLEKDGSMQFDGWRASKRLRANASLKNYVRRNFLR
jgi:hypothetical protein